MQAAQQKRANFKIVKLNISSSLSEVWSRTFGLSDQWRLFTGWNQTRSKLSHLPPHPEKVSFTYHTTHSNMASCSSLVERLEKNIECSECHDMYTDPKTLPCLHTFCCHCLNQLAKRRKSNQEPIACPDCKTEINLTEGSTFDALPSSSYLNRLKDIVLYTNQQELHPCGSCNNKSTVVAFYFNCECFICAKCQQWY